MPSAEPCLSAEDLQQYLLGQAPETDGARIEQHLRQCRRCLDTIQALKAEDTLIEALRSQGPAALKADPEALKQRIDRLCQLHPTIAEQPTGSDQGTQAVGSKVDRESYDFLAPAQAPGDLGRLGSYRVLKVLGAGGMGVVFQAEDIQLKRLVALKAMKPSLAASDSARQRFLREAQTAAAIEHDHIVTIHQVGEDRGVPFIAMPFLRGQPLDHWLEGGRKPSIAQAVRLGQQIAAGLAAAHERGLIHRDIKPGNIWLESTTNRVKILDFGLARSVDDRAHLTQSGAIVGTPAYMSPEQARGEAVDHRTDLFSLGCLLYRLVTGRVPFEGSSTMAVLSALALTDPKPVRELNPDVPPALAELIHRLLAKEPKQRPASANEVVQALQRIAGTLSVPSADATLAGAEVPKEQRSRPRRRWPWAVAAAAAVVAAVLAAPLIIRITHKDGTVQDVAVPDGAKVELIQAPPAPPVKRARSVIFLWMGGGPSQLDTFDLKPGQATGAPFKEIETTAKGIRISEHLPNLARFADHMLFIRSLTHRNGDHTGGAYLMHTGYEPRQDIEYPALAALLAKELGSERSELPNFVCLTMNPVHAQWCSPGFLGPRYGPLTMTGAGRATRLPELADFQQIAGDRAETMRRAMTEVTDLKDETQAVRLAYGPQAFGLRCLLARRLVERGVPVIELDLGGWDNHASVFNSVEKLSGDLDAGWGALLADLQQRKLLDTTLIVWMGEFGRTPRINANQGRDHWPHGFTVVLAGGGIKGGQVIGRTSADGTKIEERPVTVPEFWATICTLMGVDPTKRYKSNKGIMVPLVETDAKPIAEVLAKKPNAAPDDAWLKAVAAMEPPQQVEAVVAKLKECNPGFNAQVRHTIRANVVTALDLRGNYLTLTDLSPVRALPGLRGLTCIGSVQGKGNMTDLTPLKGLPLTYLDCSYSNVSDLTSLRGMPLTNLYVFATLVSDLSPLKDLPLMVLNCDDTNVADLAPLKDKKLTTLTCRGTRVTDLSPLKGMPLKELRCDFNPERDAAILRSLKTLEKINDKPAAEFWREVDAQKKPPKP
jgi:hypothetical protein